MEKTVEEEVKDVLEQTTDKVEFEESLDAENSPLNQPVAENEIGHNSTTAEKKEPATDDVLEETIDEELEEKKSSTTDNDDFHFESNAKDDVPEQEIGSGEYDEQIEDEMPGGDDFEIPNSHAKRATEAIFGIADNVITVGGGFFIKIKKHKEFFEFEEIIQIIEEHNEKNVKRLKLDEDDKILLRPLLIAMLKQKAKQLTPEQQLLGAVLSILMKKAQTVLEIKAENEIMVERILGVIRQEKGYSDQDVEEETEQVTPQAAEPEVEEVKEEKTAAENTSEEEVQTVEEVEVIEEAPENLSNTLLEIADEAEQVEE